MLLLEGIPISPGCASGIAVVYDYEIERRFDLPRRAISHAEVESECNRLDQALERSNQDWKLVAQAALCEPKLEDSAEVSMAHSAMAKEIAALVRQHVGREVVNVERALDSVILDFVERLQGLDNAYLREREQDVRDVGRRMMRHLGGSPPWTNESLPPGSVIVARELMPSEAVELAQSGVVAIVSEHGGTFSHTAIVARSLGTPAITGISNVTSQIEPGMRLLVHGETGRVVIATVDCVADQLGLLRRPPIGAMIETPAALFALDEILDIADFVAIGTNDLTQYMLAADRDLTTGTDDCTALHPAVLRAIQQVVEVAEGRHRPVCVCGEEAGNVDFACLLVGMGVRELSLSPARAVAVRHAVRHIEYHEARKVAGLALRCQTPQQVQKLVQQLQSPESQCNSVSNGESSRTASGEATTLEGTAQLAAAVMDQQKQGDADRAAITAARTVQRALFPQHAPIMPGFDIAGAVHPAERVSGDFFDYISLGQHSVGIVVGDVSGHGLGPALLMAQTQAYLRALAESHADPGELLTHANRLFATSDSGCFVTIFLACIDAEKRTLVYASAGHQGYLISNNGIAQKLNSPSVPLGVHATAASTSAPAIVLNAGGILLIPTDGIEEATSPGGTMFGQQRVHEVVRKNRGKSAAQIVDALFRAAREFSERELQIDDITAVVVKVLPTSPAETSAQPAGSR